MSPELGIGGIAERWRSRTLVIARVLVVEDDLPTRDLLVQILEGDGYDVVAVGSGAAALEAVASRRPDVALIDGGLPDLQGREVARRIRLTSDLPIIFVTAADAVEDRRAGFAVGGDDYVVKPFDSEELSGRVRAVLRRTGHTVARVWEVGNLIIDEPAHETTRGGTTISLTAIEFSLLVALVRRRGRVVPKAQLLDDVWGYSDRDDNVVEQHVSSLRRKLEVQGPRIIHTVREFGYVLRT